MPAGNPAHNQGCGFTIKLEGFLMTRRRPSPIDCVVRDAAGTGTKGKTGSLREVSKIEPLKRVLNSGLSEKDLEQIDISRPVMQSIRECAQSEDKSRLQPEQTLAAVNSTLKLIDIQVQMLNLRKKALKRRSRILDRLAESFANHQDHRWAA
jgi:hypothetical protein